MDSIERELKNKILEAQKIIDWVNNEKKKIVQIRKSIEMEKNELKFQKKKLRYDEIRFSKLVKDKELEEELKSFEKKSSR